MTPSFKPPLSGAVLDVLVDVLELRRWDPHGTLATRTTRRYFAGERVRPEAEAAVHRAVAEALVASDLVPASLTLADLLPVTPPGLPEVPPTAIVGATLARYAETWDALAGALRRSTAPIAFPGHAAGACLRLVAVDVAVRIAALLWLTRNPDERPVLDFWTTPKGMGTWLRAKLDATGKTRDALAASVNVAPTTLDGWLDNDVRPSFENIDDLARALTNAADEHTDLRRRLRLAFAARDLFRRIEVVVGRPQALGICQRVAFYANEMVGFPRSSSKPLEENDMKMRIALTAGTLGAERMKAQWICSMVNHLWRNEHNPVWRTTLRAVTRSWLEHLQAITAKLGPVDEHGLTAIFGRPPSSEEIDVLAFRMQASKEEEEEREPVAAAAMLSEMLEDGARGALELKLRACEASNRGDRLGAIDLLRAAVLKDPMNAEIHFRLGCDLWQVGDVAAGLTELEIAVQLDPAWDRPRVEVAIVLMNEGRDEAARAKLVAANAECPGTPWVLLHLGYVHERLGETKEAIGFYEDLLAIDEDHAEALDRVAHLHFVHGNKRSGADRAKRAAHLGLSTVADAHRAGYYDRGKPADRPPHAKRLDGYLRFPDSAWRSRRSDRG